MAELERPAYRGPRELLAEKFHMSEELLVALNPGKNLSEAGASIIVANVGQEAPSSKGSSTETTGSTAPERPRSSATANKIAAARVEVDKAGRLILVYAEDGSLIASFPASIGSDDKPAPSGTLKVRAVVQNPTYRYDPKYAFKGQRAKKPVEIAPGPNNPVGLVWIALSAEGYGIHGTPDPEKVSKTQSHGCIRLTNWDAISLGKMVRRGTPVEFKE
jgi:lipoprotein-anchoring transpeptidase ErfK/SrfK